jgi:hypothetical protein
MSVIRLMKSATENLSLCSEEVLGYSLASEVVCPMWEKFCFSSVLREVWVDDISRQLAMSCFHIFSDEFVTVILWTEAVEIRLCESWEYIQEDGINIFRIAV